MDTLIVGEEPCTIPKIMDIMRKSASFSVLCKNWQKFARSLEIPEVNILELGNDLRLGLNNLEGLLVNLLHVWIGKYGNDATLEVLCKALTNCTSKAIADKLKTEFAEIVMAHIFVNGEVSLHGKVLKVSEIFNTIEAFPVGISKNFRKDKNPIEILKKDFQVPNRLRYYIQRTVSPRTQLNTNVFTSVSSDVFVLENLDWSNLDDKLFGCNVERSSTQTVCVTAKFILLDFERDYERICQVAPSGTPVHLVRFERGNYYWVRSRGSLKLIQQHASSEEEGWSEQECVKKHLSKFRNASVCIADTAGMGKSFLLVSIAQMVKEAHHDRVVLFLELGQSSTSQAAAMNTTTADLFWKQITTSEFAAEALKRLIESDKFQFELFLDGFDEVLPTQIDNVNHLLLSLKEYKNIRIHVATRPHMRNQLEETLGVLGYSILPFTGENQVNFLTRFWGNCEESRGEELDDSRLKSFAEQCLEMLNKSMNEQERDIAGIPLQCALLAEVYAYDAVKYSMKKSSTEFELTCKVESIFHMFQQLVKKKMKRVEALGEGEKQQLLVAHVCEALELIFPDNDTCLLKGGNEDLLKDLYAVGLVEPSSSDAGASPKFLHRTFAEFLIAEHLVKHLKCTPCSRLLVDVVLGKLTGDSENEFIFTFFLDSPELDYSEYIEVLSYEFSQNTIAHFVNAHLGAVGSDFQTASLRSLQNVDEMLNACCLNNYSGIFKGLSKVVLSGQVDSKAWTDMALVAARYSEPNLMEQLVQLIQDMEGKLLSELEFMKQNFSFSVTPLHVAVQRGSYIMTRYLLNKIYTSLEFFPYLLHSCVYGSSNDCDAIVKEKIEIIKLLIRMRKELVHEKLPDYDKTPLLQRFVHVDLIQALIEQGADVNAVGSDGDTVLHKIFKYDKEFHPITPAGYSKVFNLLRSSNFNLWDKKGGDDETPLHLAVKSIEVEHSVLDQYSHLLVDFNHTVINENGREFSVLFTAICKGRTATFITKLEQHGADVNYLNPKGESALHVAAKYGNYDVARYLVTKRNFEVNHRDCDRLTPLHVALLSKSPNHIKIQALLIDNGAEFEDPEYKWRPTTLYFALSTGIGLSLYMVKKIVANGLSKDHLALALDPLVKNEFMKPGGIGSEYSNFFRYLYEHGGRIQNAAKKLEQHKEEFARAIAINDELLEQLKAAERTDELVLDEIRSATDLYERIVAGNIQLEQVMLALLECNQLEPFETFRELLRYKNPKFGHALPEVREFILAGNQMIVVTALDLELCAKRVLDTIACVVEYQEGMDLLPGTLCLVKVQHLEHNFREYLGGLTERPYRFIVVCEKSLAAEVDLTCKVVQDHIGWYDLAWNYQERLKQGEFIGFKLSEKSKNIFFSILRDESLLELMKNKRVSTDHLGRLIEHLVDQLDEEQLKVLERHCVVGDEDQGRQLLREMRGTIQEKIFVKWFVAARAVLKPTWNDQQQMEQFLEYAFECEECQHTNTNEEEDKETDKDKDGDEKHETILVPVRQKSYWFKRDIPVFLIDWLVGRRGYNLSFNFQPDWLDKFIDACLNSNAVNLMDCVKLDHKKM